MSLCPTLRCGSGGPCVTYLQRMLNAYRKDKPEIPVNGLFGVDTKIAVREFQQRYGLEADGVVGRYTWAEMTRHGFNGVTLPPVGHVHEVEDSPLPGFLGNADWIHEWEGHVGKPYWPGGKSGVTLDPGFDLGYAEKPLIEKVWRPRLTNGQMAAVLSACGYKGKPAKDYLDSVDARTLRTVRVSSSEAKDVFPEVLAPYWKSLVSRFPGLVLPNYVSGLERDLQGAVQTALLSIGFNRGPGNPALASLKEPLQARRFSVVGNLIAAMQQDHELPGIRRRRRAEGALILNLL